MPLVLNEDILTEMSTEQLLIKALEEYAYPDNWEPYEKDYGCGAAMRPAWALRDKGDYARRVLARVSKKRRFNDG